MNNKQIIKNCVLFSVCFIMIAMFSSITAEAKTYTYNEHKTLYNELEKRFKTAVNSNFEGIKTETKNGKTIYYLDINDLNATKNETNLKVLWNFKNYCPYFGNGLDVTSITYYSSKNSYAALKIETTLSVSEIKSRITSTDKKVNALVSQVKAKSGTENKVLYLHDYIVENATYSKMSTSLDSDYDQTARCMLLNNKGVCTSYSYLFANVLNKVGIDCIVTHGSAQMNHCWNMVKIGSKWYHVDVTWDDPTPNTTGKVSHEYLLLSDKSIKAKNHATWDQKGKITCSSTPSKYWRNVQSPVVLKGSYSYYIKDKCLIKRNISKGTTSKVVKNIGTWYKMGSSKSYWVGTFSGAFANGDYIYFNTPSKIKKYNTKTGKVYTVATISNSKARVYGIRKVDKKIYYSYKTSPTAKETVKSVTLK